MRPPPSFPPSLHPSYHSANIEKFASRTFERVGNSDRIVLYGRNVIRGAAVRPGAIVNLLSSAVWLLGAALGAAAAPLQGSSHVVRMMAKSWSEARQIALQPMRNLDYGSFRWLELSAADF